MRLTAWPPRPIWLPICKQLLKMANPALLTAAFDDVERARAKLRGQPRYTLEELLAQCDPNAGTFDELDRMLNSGSEI